MTTELDYSAPLTADKLSLITLSTGSHKDREDGLCIMEAVAWLAGEPHSDAPQCACPTIRSYLIRINDSGPQWLRDELKLRLPLIIGTRGTVELQKRRAKVFVSAAMRQSELVLPVFEAKFPNDDRPRKAIAAAKTANAAADAAAGAAYAAAYAAGAAYAAADAAAGAAGVAAGAADAAKEHWLISLAAIDEALALTEEATP